MVEHMKMCPLSIQHCEYAYLGCSFAGTVKQREIHTKLEVANHLKFAVQLVGKLEGEVVISYPLFPMGYF